MPRTPPPLKTVFQQRREREFLYLHEVDAVITAMEQTRYPTRNKAIAMALFCQCLQPSELCWLRRSDLDLTRKTLYVIRNRELKSGARRHKQINLQLLCAAEVDLLQQLALERRCDWLFATERQTRLNQRSLHYLIAQAGKIANLTFPIHPYMLRRSGLFYRAALLLQPLHLSLQQCCLLWNWHGTKVEFDQQQEREMMTMGVETSEAFLAALKQLQSFTRIQSYDNLIDYLLGAFLLFPHLDRLPSDYWLAPVARQRQLYRKDPSVTSASSTLSPSARA
ncbi:integrase [Chroococcidiopsis sp. CCALA 051]|uniref:tyrosine-type recombinase/integrase n=1 Tax=Chroococcidiopsis sp. CCALA 051 TaxID=869949 RepID=UPI000D0CA240|nr:tyrosine-type recombinase/integrase [Chroococcidiopsis sp. CCALA 051]MBE9019190.1 tyrosine-type recombinase/integrase [Chroococcidiopsidales cyanobacterium LEGE 13417]PSM46029.1 integrase [Chroococcidiopsis sp. CCALA 051]